MRLPVTTAPVSAACSCIQAMLGPSISSASPCGAIVKPVVNISGRTIKSVAPAKGASKAENSRRLASRSSQCRACCTNVARKGSIEGYKCKYSTGSTSTSYGIFVWVDKKYLLALQTKEEPIGARKDLLPSFVRRQLTSSSWYLFPRPQRQSAVHGGFRSPRPECSGH